MIMVIKRLDKFVSKGYHRKKDEAEKDCGQYDYTDTSSATRNNTYFYGTYVEKKGI